MLGKLLKYDLKWIYKTLLVFYALGLVFAVFTRIFLNIENSMLFSIVGKVTNGIMIGVIISGIINSVIRSWVRFINNLYKDESYLTHTLPVQKKTIYLSKVLTAIICTFTSVLVALLCIFISYYSKENMEGLKSFLKLTAGSYDTTVFMLILDVALVFFLEVVFVILIGYVSIIIGHKLNRNKMLITFILGICLYNFTSSLTLGIVYFVGLFNSNVMNIINTTNIIEVSAMRTVMYIGLGAYVVYCLVYYLIGKKLLNKGVNID